MKSTDTRPIGRTALQSSILGFGGAPLGNLNAVLSDDQSVATVRRAKACGVTLFDTAPLYGYGLSEHLVGEALRWDARDGYVLSTKVGRRLVPDDPANIDGGLFQRTLPFQPVYDYSYDGAMRSVEDSLQRMALQRIDVLLIHDVDVWTHGTREATDARFDEAMSGAYKAMLRLREEGTIKAIGVGVNEADMCERFARAGDFDCFLLAGRYTLLEQGALDGLLPLCQERNIGIMLGGPYNSGILATGARPGAYYNYHRAPPEIMDRVSRIEAVCKRHNVALAAAALQFPLGHPCVFSVIPGAVKPGEIDRNVATMDVAIPADLWAELKAEGLLREDAPVPAQ
ncbi:aldo/keto reductase [Fodinicurvata sp. EGI_FJ10296]|uniref:aldo/keto reductase n=1 Tax=Fodinicurvata sp. EGI_FJ10296 TaxID=3231908 RepID=UPI003451F6BB